MIQNVQFTQVFFCASFCDVQKDNAHTKDMTLILGSNYNDENNLASQLKQELLYYDW